MAYRLGDRVGTCTLTARLGVGGMGEVFLAEDSETGARYAFKTLTEFDENAVARFQREAEAQAAADSHPHVLRVHSYGQDPRGTFLLLEYAPGGDLSERARATELTAQESSEIVRAVASGIAHVHRAGVLHRDLKPENVLFDERGVPKIGDFGLARPQKAVALTATGEILGTPGYMAPEQASGERGGMDERTDIYGLGGLLYFCLTGTAPNEGKGLVQVLGRLFEGKTLRPSQSTAGVPRELDAICARCLAKAPEDRYPSAGAVADALGEYLDGGGATTPPWAKFAGASSVLLIVVLLGLIYAVWPRPEPRPLVDATTKTPLDVKPTPLDVKPTPLDVKPTPRVEAPLTRPTLPIVDWNRIRLLVGAPDSETLSSLKNIPNPREYYRRGKTFRRGNRGKDAAYCFLKAIDADPKSALANDATFELGRVLIRNMIPTDDPEARAELGRTLILYTAVNDHSEAQDVLASRLGVAATSALDTELGNVAVAWLFLAYRNSPDLKTKQAKKERDIRGRLPEVSFPTSKEDAWNRIAEAQLKANASTEPAKAD